MLCDMGHGDQLALVDRNYPGHSSGRPVVHLGDVSVTRAAQAILAVIPLDTFITHPLERMEADDNPATELEGHADVLAIARVGWPTLEYATVPRASFYERVRDVQVVVQTLDARPYSCFILQKGVIL